MRQQTEISHTLQVRDRPGVSFRPTEAGMYQEARKLADQGQIQAALDRACDLHIENYGHMRGTSFRVVTTIRTVSMHNSWEEFEA